MFDWDAELPDSERDALLEALAQKVQRYRLAAPAVLYLELHKPVTFFGSQALLFGSGILAPLFGPQNLQKYVKLLEKRENIELLIRRIEELSVAAPSDAPSSGPPHPAPE